MTSLTKRLATIVAVVSLAFAAGISACSNAPPSPPKAGSSYNPSPGNDPNGAKVPALAPCSGYNVASGRCGDSTQATAAAKLHIAAADSSCPFGYIIAYGECVPASTKVPASAVTAHVKVAIPSETVYWIAADQRFRQDLVANQPVVVNAICDSTQTGLLARTIITKGDSSWLDFGGCKSVVKAVVDEWFYAWAAIKAAHPTWSSKAIQDAIAAGAY